MPIYRVLSPLCRRFLLIFASVFASDSIAFGYSPEDPEVQELVAGGIKHLEQALSENTHYAVGQAFYGGWGEWALAGYAHYKVEQDINNPVVKKGIEGALNIAKGLAETDPGGNITTTNYNAGVSAMLLTEVDREKYRKELEAIVAYYKKAQLTNGPYTYKGESQGDTSQTQYAMLALWTLEHAGFPIDYQGLTRTIGWLTRVQDVDGGWPYKGTDPQGGKNRIKQPTVSTSMALAGGSSVLIAGDILRLWGATAINDPKIDGLPKAIKLFEDENLSVKRPKLPVEPLVKAIQDCEGYLAKNSPNPGVSRSEWPYYQLYTLERYESFKEIAFSRKKDNSPRWYNDGVEFLKKERDPNGGWSKGNHMTSSVSTAFAILFLIRSTQKAIQRMNSGSLAGGYGLPSDTTKIVVSGTQIKGEPAVAAVTDLLNLLESDESGSLESNSIPENLKLADDPKARRSQIDRLERLVRGSQSWQARRVAARLLGQSDELRVVPSLIYALSDPDKPVRRFANDGLAFISRKFDAFSLPDKPTDDDIRKVQNAWRDWFLSINPSYVFLD